jgi:hypothetical protein
MAPGGEEKRQVQQRGGGERAERETKTNKRETQRSVA